MGSQWSQFFPPAPTLAANDGDCQHGKVLFVTGDYSCIGLELAKMIYNKQTRVYLASRSGQAAMQAIKGIGIKASVEDFKAQETELHGLWNNAGVISPRGSVSNQRFELQLAVNCLGLFLFT
ncbi:putative Short-chain dehydrogenase [Seiridium unicorne]|uniref:Short-chain dehydrogenase n=1 Tax=Seiridium unicorne TaxID=138068 RepID=A0ABR2UMH0_9PEZI